GLRPPRRSARLFALLGESGWTAGALPVRLPRPPAAVSVGPGLQWIAARQLLAGRCSRSRQGTNLSSAPRHGTIRSHAGGPGRAYLIARVREFDASRSRCRACDACRGGRIAQARGQAAAARHRNVRGRRAGDYPRDRSRQLRRVPDASGACETRLPEAWMERATWTACSLTAAPPGSKKPPG